MFRAWNGISPGGWDEKLLTKFQFWQQEFHPHRKKEDTHSEDGLHGIEDTCYVCKWCAQFNISALVSCGSPWWGQFQLQWVTQREGEYEIVSILDPLQTFKWILYQMKTEERHKKSMKENWFPPDLEKLRWKMIFFGGNRLNRIFEYMTLKFFSAAIKRTTLKRHRIFSLNCSLRIIIIRKKKPHYLSPYSVPDC